MSRRAKRNLFIASILTILTAGTVMFVFSSSAYAQQLSVTTASSSDCTGSGSGPCGGDESCD